MYQILFVTFFNMIFDAKAILKSKKFIDFFNILNYHIKYTSTPESYVLATLDKYFVYQNLKRESKIITLKLKANKY